MTLAQVESFLVDASNAVGDVATATDTLRQERDLEALSQRIDDALREVQRLQRRDSRAVEER